MPTQGLQHVSVARFPHNDRVVSRATGYDISVGAQGQTPDPVAMPCEGPCAVPRGYFPALERVVARTCVENVASKHHGGYGVVVAAQRLHTGEGGHVPYLGAHIGRGGGQQVTGWAERHGGHGACVAF